MILLIAVLLMGGCTEDRLKLDSVKPSKVKAGRQAMVDIRGRGFSEDARVWFGDRESRQTISVSQKRIIAMTPVSMPGGTADVRVENPDGTSAELEAAINFESSMALARAMPSRLQPAEGKNIVRLRGRAFSRGARVFFAELESPGVEVKNERLILAELPGLEPGVVDVRVMSPDGSEAVLEGGLQVLGRHEEAPLQPLHEQAHNWGLAYDERTKDTGAAIADINRDGFMDLLIIASDVFRLYLGTGKGSFQHSPDSGLDPGRGLYNGAFFGDFDNDRLPDLIVTGQHCKLFHNLGEARFQEVTKQVGLPFVKGWAAAWIDFDADGLLDLFIGDPQNDDRLFHNTGTGFEQVFPRTFEKESLAMELGNRQPTTFSAAAADYDNDSFPDLFVGVRGQPSALYHNMEGEGFENATEKTGLDFEVAGQNDKRLFKANWGVYWADYNNDGFLDLFAASGPFGTDLYQNQQGKSFVNVTRYMRVEFSGMTLCPAWGDLDNDGFLDVAVSDNIRGIRVYKNLGDGTFKEVSDELNMGAAGETPMAIVWADVNQDGALDLFASQYLREDNLFINTPYPGRHYLKVKLEGGGTNAMGIGAVVVLQCGKDIFTRQVSGGQAYLASEPFTLHFGLGSAERVDKLSVRWPGGELQAIEDVGVDKIITIKQEGEPKKFEFPEEQPASGREPGSGAK